MSAAGTAAADTPPPRPPGTEVAPGHVLLGHLSRGRHLDVHDAWSTERAARCVVKMLRPDVAGDRPAARRLEAEARLLRRLEHPHIVRGYAARGASEPIAVMETLTGETLAHLIQTAPRRLQVAEVAHLGMHLASALRYLHAAGWLHLDLKPSNVVAEAGRAKLIDLSVAQRPGRVDAGRGTWCYLSPEQAHGGTVTPAADMWGLGAVLYEATAGEPPFGTLDVAEGSAGEDDVELTGTLGPEDYPQLAGPPEPVRRLRRGAPGELAALIHACLDMDPGGRPAADDALNVLARLAGVPVGPPVPATPQGSPTKR